MIDDARDIPGRILEQQFGSTSHSLMPMKISRPAEIGLSQQIDTLTTRENCHMVQPLRSKRIHEMGLWSGVPHFWRHPHFCLSILEHSGAFRSIQEHSGAFGSILEHSAAFWSILECLLSVDQCQNDY